MDALERLMEMPSGLTVTWLRLDPRWDALRERADFQALLKKYEV